MPRMKLSRYAHFADSTIGKSVYLMSFLTMGLAELEPHFADLVKQGRFSDLPPHIRDDLVDADLLVPESRDERGEPLVRLLRSMVHWGDHLALTVVPTTACNFACPYCFEIEKPVKYMTEDVMDAVLSLVAERSPKELVVVWYGGEPLLALSQIRRLSDRLIEYCAEAGAKYVSRIITNGYFLTKDVAAELRELHVYHAQVTLDGAEDMHDSRRCLRDGSQT